jgi:hypothetical protein
MEQLQLMHHTLLARPHMWPVYASWQDDDLKRRRGGVTWSAQGATLTICSQVRTGTLMFTAAWRSRENGSAPYRKGYDTRAQSFLCSAVHILVAPSHAASFRRACRIHCANSTKRVMCRNLREKLGRIVLYRQFHQTMLGSFMHWPFEYTAPDTILWQSRILL